MTKKTLAYKAFNSDWTCRGFQFEVGKTYEHEDAIKVCSSGFHACENPLDTLTYYPLVGSKFAVVEFEGDTQGHSEDSKLCGAKITIAAEVRFGDLIERAASWIIESVICATSGNRSPSATSGDDSRSEAKGANSPAAAMGRCAEASAGVGGGIALAEYDENGTLVAMFASLVGDNGIKPNTVYTLKSGKPVEVTS